jgi:serine/threonine-protein kinase
MNLPDGYYLQNRKYQLTNAIGQGGFGITYLGVWNTEVKGGLGTMKTKVPVCIKEYFFKDYCYRERSSYAIKVHSATGDKLFHKFKEKLIKEANILSEVHHPHIVNVLEVFEENNTAYIVMEYIKGCSLKYMLDTTGVLPEDKVLKYVHQIGNALSFVHEKNIVHLDIKPSNILIDKNDNARLIDFGVSKRYDIKEQETSTTTLTLSKGFASIEQYDDEGIQNFSPCPDIYSLGATMYNVLTGIIPIESILRVTKELIPPTECNSNISLKTEATIVKALSLKPQDRFQTITEMLASLDIPPYEFTGNNLNEPDDTAETSDHTEILRNNPDVKDEDRTLVVTKSKKKSLKKRKKKRSLILASFLGFIFIIIAYAAVDYFYSNNLFKKRMTVGTKTNVPTEKALPVKMLVFKTVSESYDNSNNTESDVLSSKNNTTNERSNNVASNTVAQTVNNPAVNNNIKNDSLSLSSSDIKVIDEKYKNLFSSAKNFFDNKRYKEARRDADKAYELKPTEEAYDLLKNCDLRIEEEEIKIRKEQYNITVPFGNLFLVSRKDNGLHGAINSNGDAIIPCIYQTSDPHVDGRAFMREDGKYDIYSESGEPRALGLSID